MFLLAAVRFNVEIRHRFSEVGHTHNEGDSMHALIERKSKAISIFSPADWITIIKSAKSTKQPYVVIEVQQEHIFDLKDLVNKQFWELDVKGKKIALSKIREIYVKGDCENTVLFKYDFTQDYN